MHTIRPVVFAINVGADDVARLHEHVVQGGAHGPGAHTVRVPRVPRHYNSVTVRIRENEAEEGVAHPMAGALGDEDEGDEEG